MAIQESTPSAASVDVMGLRDTLLLAAFATEARRVLTEIEHVLDGAPDMAETMSSMVRARRQWTMYQDTVPQVLNGVAQQLEILAGGAE